MALELDEQTREFIGEHRVAHLATADARGQPLVIPICYVFDGERLYSPVDEKPKSRAPRQLKRIRNLAVNPRVSLVIDDYAEDWSRLAYVLIQGLAQVIEPGGEQADEHARATALLREKYAQYRVMAIDQRPMIKITPTRIKRWGAGLLPHRL